MAAGARLSIRTGAMAAGMFACLAGALADPGATYAAGGSAAPPNGKLIYRKGRAAAPPAIQARLDNGPAQSGENFTCAGCHGARGEGGQQAALRVPPIDWATLTAPRPKSAFWRPRGGYDANTLKRVILQGVDADGAALGPGMPRFTMSGGQAAALAAYLQVIGTDADNDPGVSADSVTIGAALPLSGPMAGLGAQVLAKLQSVFDEVNGKGGIYQRRIALVTADSGSDTAGALAATRRLADADVFALVANFQPAEPDAFNGLVAGAEIPSIGPLGQAPLESARQNPFVWHLLPTFADQARALADDIVTGGLRDPARAPRVALVSADTPNASDALRGAKAQLAIARAAVTSEIRYEGGALFSPEVVSKIADGDPEWILFFGPAADLRQLAAQIAKSGGKAPAIGAMTLLSPVSYNQTTFQQLDMAFVAPIFLESAPDVAATELQGSNSPVFQMMAAAAARTLVEAMSRAGRNLDRSALQAELERLRDFETGVLPPLSFSRGNHVGLRAAAILRITRAPRQLRP